MTLMRASVPGAMLGRSRARFGHAFDLARSRVNRQHNRPATNAAIFDQRLFGLGCVDLQREGFTAMRTNDVGFVNQLHFPISRRELLNYTAASAFLGAPAVSVSLNLRKCN